MFGMERGNETWNLPFSCVWFEVFGKGTWNLKVSSPSQMGGIWTPSHLGGFKSPSLRVQDVVFFKKNNHQNIFCHCCVQLKYKINF